MDLDKNFNEKDVQREIIEKLEEALKYLQEAKEISDNASEVFYKYEDISNDIFWRMEDISHIEEDTRNIYG